jgi:hypothetical protein
MPTRAPRPPNCVGRAGPREQAGRVASVERHLYASIICNDHPRKQDVDPFGEPDMCLVRDRRIKRVLVNRGRE